jgi:hypothetical protein
MRMTLKRNNARRHLMKFERSFATRCIRWTKALGLGFKTDRSNSSSPIPVASSRRLSASPDIPISNRKLRLNVSLR